MTLRCLKCGASRRTRAKLPERIPCTFCSSWLIPIGGEQILKVAQQLFKCGFNIVFAESFCYSFNPTDFGHNNCPARVEAVWIRLAFGRSYDSDVFIELPEIYCDKLADGWQIFFDDNSLGYKKFLGDVGGVQAEKALIEQLYSWAEWLESSGMSSILLLQGKL